MLFRYRLQPVKAPIVALGGRWVRPRALATITLIGPSGTRVRQARLDPAADDTVFPETVAAHVGLDLSNAPIGEAAGVGMNPVSLRYAEVTLRLAQGNERREWRCWVGFASAPMTYPLLGFAGFLQFFTATFHGDREEVELAVNSLYPGT